MSKNISKTILSILLDLIIWMGGGYICTLEKQIISYVNKIMQWNKKEIKWNVLGLPNLASKCGWWEGREIADIINK